MKENRFRYFGEFEKQEKVIISWSNEESMINGYSIHDVMVEVIKQVSSQVDVILNVNQGCSVNACREKLINAEVDMSKIKFTYFEDKLRWARDYGPDILGDEDGNKLLVNFKFDTYGGEFIGGPYSNPSEKFGPHMSIELGCTNIINSRLISEGGDREFNGNGVLMTLLDTEVKKRNPSYTKDEIESEYKRLFNLDTVIWLNKPTFDDEQTSSGPLDIIDDIPIYRSSSANGHIDEMCRFTDTNTIILVDVTEKEASELTSARITKERMEDAYNILKDVTDSNGNPFNILRMPIPDPIYIDVTEDEPFYTTFKEMNPKMVIKTFDTYDKENNHRMAFRVQPALSYCNFLILNEIVLGQKYYQEGMSLSIKQKDTEAKKVLEKAFPNRKVIMINSLALNICGGGIHCMTKNIPYITGRKIKEGNE